jgi:hypothetical protein
MSSGLDRPTEVAPATTGVCLDGVGMLFTRRVTPTSFSARPAPASNPGPAALPSLWSGRIGGGGAFSDEFTVVTVERVLVPIVSVLNAQVRRRDHAPIYPSLDCPRMLTAIALANSAPVEEAPLRCGRGHFSLHVADISRQTVRAEFAEIYCRNVTERDATSSVTNPTMPDEGYL